jgi:hypothetical protein
MGQRAILNVRVAPILLAVLVLALAGCSGATTTSGPAGLVATATAVATATPQSPCVQLVPGAVPTQGVNGVPGIQLPSGTYIGPGTVGGSGQGQYAVESYTLCFQGAESAIDGGSASSTLSALTQSGWKMNNLFPDPKSVSYLDYCSSGTTGHECVNNSGSPNPFTFVSFDQYASQSGGYTTFRLQVATIAAPSCLNDPTYYSGTPKYTIYEDGNSASSSNPTYHFLMPPGTRVSTFQGGGTAGSTYVYFCSAGTQATVVNFLVQSMQNTGWTISSAASAGFTATKSGSPTYSVVVSVQNANNYYLRIFVPM